MGLNIVVAAVDGAEHPTWDAVRRNPDRDLAALIESLPSKKCDDFDGDALLRPLDFTVWKRAAPAEQEARSRYLELLCILENEPGYWVHLSY